MDEFQLIDHYFKNAIGHNDGVITGIGDDAAVLQPQQGFELVFAADAMVENRHFTKDVLPYDLGYKSLAVNLSDIAAMGAIPRWFTLTFGFNQVDEAWLADFTHGMATLAHKFGCALVGGDTVASEKTFISISVIGEVEAGTALLRSGAKEGDLIVLGGPIGFAGDGWRNPKTASAKSLEHFYRPEPQIELGRLIRPYATSCIDISDGLLSELDHLSNESEVKMRVDVEPIKKQHDIGHSTERLTELVTGGEDYVLLFTMSNQDWRRISNENPKMTRNATIIGRCIKGEGVDIFDGNRELKLNKHGFRHFESSQ